MTIGFINSVDGFEAVRNATANILVGESLNQVSLAEAWNVENPDDSVDPDEWVLDVYVERANPFELFRGEDNTTTQLINVWYEDSDVDNGKSSQVKQATNSSIVVDCLACGVTAETIDGQEPGDESAFLRVHKVARLARRILMHPDYRQLGIPSVVGYRRMSSRRSFQPGGGDVPHHHIAGVQIKFDVSHCETYDYLALEASEGALVTIYREPDGKILAQMDYDWT